MELNLKKPLVFFDLETTGVNYSHDKIVELSYVKVMPNGKEQEDTMRFNPGMHIPEQATAVHHITDADVANCPTFKERAKEIAKVFEGCDIAGYNSNRFDVPMLIEEFLNAGVNFDYTKCRFVDVQTILQKVATDRDKQQVILDLITLIWRDTLMVNSGITAANRLHFNNILGEMGEVVRKYSPQQLLATSQLTLETRHMLEQNISFQNIVEQLTIRLVQVLSIS